MTKFFLTAGLLASINLFSQTISLPSTGTNSASTNGTTNVYVGSFAGASTTTTNNGSHNVFTGYQSGQLSATGDNNVFSGYQAGKSNDTGDNNVYVGNEAGKNTNGSSNVFCGSFAGSLSTGGQNIFIGQNAGLNSVESYNVFVGHAAGENSVGGNNLFSGHQAGRMNTGQRSVLLGSSAGRENVSGSNNTMVGYLAGQNSTGSLNVFLGAAAGRDETGNNKLYIANTATINPLIYGEFANGSNPGLIKFNAKKVGIGYDSAAFGAFPTLTFTDADSYRLFVKGGILAYQMRIRLQTGWADYVFNKDYKLMSLKETEKYIDENGHLPNMPSAAQVAEEGIEMGNMAKLQQEKIEELTLHVIELNKQVEALRAQNEELRQLKAKVDQLLNNKQ